jgi:hypothetical protein
MFVAYPAFSSPIGYFLFTRLHLLLCALRKDGTGLGNPGIITHNCQSPFSLECDAREDSATPASRARTSQCYRNNHQTTSHAWRCLTATTVGLDLSPAPCSTPRKFASTCKQSKSSFKILYRPRAIYANESSFSCLQPQFWLRLGRMQVISDCASNIDDPWNSYSRGGPASGLGIFLGFRPMDLVE